MIENRLPSNFIPKYNKADVFMLSTKIYFQNLIRLIINLENQLEKLRYCLGDVKSQLNCIFKNIDRCKRGFITDEDLNYFMKCNGICCTDREIGLAFIRFDKKAAPRLTSTVAVQYNEVEKSARGGSVCSL